VKYKLSVEYEAPDHQQAIKLAEVALDELPVLDHTLEVRVDDETGGPEEWDPVEG
jgi:hypothetical protein